MSTTNAKIVSTMLGREDHGIPTCWLMLDYGGAGQGFGGYDLRYYGVEFLTRILEVVGVAKWEELVGKFVRVEIGPDRLIKGIGHIVESRWFRPEREGAPAAREASAGTVGSFSGEEEAEIESHHEEVRRHAGDWGPE